MSERRLIAKPFTIALGLAVGLSLCLAKGVATAPQGAAAAHAAAVPPSPPATDEWLTWGYDQERSLWNRAEKIINKDNASQLTLKWKTQIPTPAKEEVLSTLTAPLVANVTTPQGPATFVFVAGSDNTVYAVDAATGAIRWQRPFPYKDQPKDLLSGKPITPDYRCPGTLNATPVIDKEAGIIYVSTSDGKLRGLSIVNGEDRMQAIDFTHPFARNWSLNLIDGVIYSPTARGCLNIPSHFTAVDLKDPNKRKSEFYSVGTGIPAGAWGRGGIVRGPKYLYTQTADGPYDPAAGKFGNTVIAFSFRDLRLVDTYTPENWQYLNEKDLDLSSANAVVFPFQGKTIVASVGKESVITLLDADNLGGPNHQTPLYVSPRFGNDEAMLHDRGVWGAMATWEDAQGRRFLSMSMWGPPGKSAPPFRFTNGPATDGSVMAFEVRMDTAANKPMVVPVWISRDMHAPDVPVVANGVVYAFHSGKNNTETRSAGRGRGGAGGGGGRGAGAGAGAEAGAGGAARGAAPGGGAGAAAAPAPGAAGTPTGRGRTVAPVVPSRATNAFLYALDAENGKELFRSELDSFNHFSGNPVITGGTVYTVTWDGKLSAFGLKK